MSATPLPDTCLHAGARYEFVLVNALKGEHMKPDFKKKHPAGLLPAIEVRVWPAWRAPPVCVQAHTPSG